MAAFVVEQSNGVFDVYERPALSENEPFDRVDDVRTFGDLWVGDTPAKTIDHPSDIAGTWLHKGRYDEVYLLYADGRVDCFKVVMTERFTGKGHPAGRCTFVPEHSDSDGSEDDRLSDW